MVYILLCVCLVVLYFLAGWPALLGALIGMAICLVLEKLLD
jgi:hypothetical protein